MISSFTNYGSTSNRGDIDAPLSDHSSSASAPLLPQRQISFAAIMRDPVKRPAYLKAMTCQTLRKTAEMFELTAREFTGLLAGVQFSGILNAKTNMSMNGQYWINSSCNGHEGVREQQDIAAVSDSFSMKQILDNQFGISLDSMTYAAISCWAVAHTVLPCIQRPLLSREQLFAGQILEKPLPPPDRRTLASTISWILEYAMPINFDASRYALLIKTLEQAGSYLPIYLGNTQNFSASSPDGVLSANGWVYFDNLKTATGVGEPLISNEHLYLLMGSGILMYGAQALCNFHHDLQMKEASSGAPSQISLREMSSAQKKKYAGALFSRAVKKGTEVLKGILESSIGTLAGLQLSGALNATTQTLIAGGFGFLATCPGENPIYDLVPIVGTSKAYTIGDQLDQRLIVTTEMLTYAAASAWLLGSALIPRIQRCLQTKEDTLMHELLHADTPAPQNTQAGGWAARLNALSEFLLPGALNGAAYGLLFHAFEKSKGAFELISQTPETWTYGDGNFVVELAAGIYELFFSITSGEIPVPTEALGMIFAAGVMMYLSQAWFGFHRDLQKKAAITVEPDQPLANPAADTESDESSPHIEVLAD